MGILVRPRRLRSACGSVEPASEFSPARTQCVVIRRRSRTRRGATLKPPAADNAELCKRKRPYTRARALAAPPLIAELANRAARCKKDGVALVRASGIFYARFFLKTPIKAVTPKSMVANWTTELGSGTGGKVLTPV